MYRAYLGTLTASSSNVVPSVDVEFKGTPRPTGIRVLFSTINKSSKGTSGTKFSVYPLWRVNGAIIVEATSIATVTVQTSVKGQARVLVAPSAAASSRIPVAPDGLRIKANTDAGTLSCDVSIVAANE